MLITEYPAWLVFVCLLTGLGYALLLYKKTNRDISKPVRYSLFSIRLITVAFFCFFLLNPLLKTVTTFNEKPVIIIAADNSASITRNKDSVFYRNEFPASLKKLEEGLSAKYDVRFVRFSDRAEENETMDYSGRQTDIAGVIAENKLKYEGKNMGALVLATDGLYNKGSNPAYEAEKLNYPVYTIALGDTALQRDALIKKINHNASAYIGNRFPVEVQVQASGLQEKKATLSILKDGKKLQEQPLTYSSANFSFMQNFLLNADKPGVQRYEAVLSFTDGEKIRTNNLMSFVIDVVDKREKILIVANAPHPDISVLKQSIENNQSYETEVILAENFNQSLKPYSLVILHQLLQNSLAAKKLQAEISLNKTPVWQFSRNDFWASTALRLNSSASRFTESEAIYNNGFALFTISPELKNYMVEFPAVSSALASYKVSNGSDILIKQKIGQVETENPTLVFSEDNGLKSALFTGDGLWRWRLRDYEDHSNNLLFNELVQKTVQYLAVKADKSFFRLFTKKILDENETVDFEAEVFNPSYELINEPEVSMLITDENKKQFTYTFSKTGSAYRLSAGNFPPGDYSYEAKVKVNDKLYEQKGRFTVRPLMEEYTATTADHALLYNISRQTTGMMFYPKQLELLEKKLLENENIKTLVHEQKQLNDFINLKWIFFLLLVLLSAEWFVRKYNGLY